MGVIYVDIPTIMDTCGSASGPVKVPHFIAELDGNTGECWPTVAEHNALIAGAGDVDDFDAAADGVIPDWSSRSTAQRYVVRAAYYPGLTVPA